MSNENNFLKCSLKIDQLLKCKNQNNSDVSIFLKKLQHVLGTITKVNWTSTEEIQKGRETRIVGYTSNSKPVLVVKHRETVTSEKNVKTGNVQRSNLFETRQANVSEDKRFENSVTLENKSRSSRTNKKLTNIKVKDANLKTNVERSRKRQPEYTFQNNFKTRDKCNDCEAESAENMYSGNFLKDVRVVIRPLSESDLAKYSVHQKFPLKVDKCKSLGAHVGQNEIQDFTACKSTVDGNIADTDTPPLGENSLNNISGNDRNFVSTHSKENSRNVELGDENLNIKEMSNKPPLCYVRLIRDPLIDHLSQTDRISIQCFPLQNERTNRHLPSHRFYCPACNKSFKQKKFLNLHLAFHRRMKIFNCKICCKRFTFISSLRRHELFHKEVRLYSCTMCDKRFSSKDIRNKHQHFHVDKNRYPCTDCDKKFLHPYYLKSHKSIHRIMRPYFCNICKYTFTRESILQSHIKEHERQEVVYYCNACELPFNQLNYKIHKCKSLIKTNSKLLRRKTKRCKFCQKSFKNFRSFKLHSCIIVDNIDTVDRLSSVRSSSKNSKRQIKSMDSLNGRLKTNICCIYCKKHFNSDFGLKIHFKTVHSLRHLLITSVNNVERDAIYDNASDTCTKQLNHTTNEPTKRQSQSEEPIPVCNELSENTSRMNNSSSSTVNITSQHSNLISNNKTNLFVSYPFPQSVTLSTTTPVNNFMAPNYVLCNEQLTKTDNVHVPKTDNIQIYSHLPNVTNNINTANVNNLQFANNITSNIQQTNHINQSNRDSNCPKWRPILPKQANHPQIIIFNLSNITNPIPSEYQNILYGFDRKYAEKVITTEIAPTYPSVPNITNSNISNTCDSHYGDDDNTTKTLPGIQNGIYVNQTNATNSPLIIPEQALIRVNQSTNGIMSVNQMTVATTITSFPTITNSISNTLSINNPQHRNTNVSRNTSIQCQRCFKRFNQSSDFDDHIDNCESSFKFQYSKCHKLFPTEDNLKQHNDVVCPLNFTPFRHDEKSRVNKELECHANVSKIKLEKLETENESILSYQCVNHELEQKSCLERNPVYGNVRGESSKFQSFENISSIETFQKINISGNDRDKCRGTYSDHHHSSLISEEINNSVCESIIASSEKNENDPTQNNSFTKFSNTKMCNGNNEIKTINTGENDNHCNPKQSNYLRQILPKPLESVNNIPINLVIVSNIPGNMVPQTGTLPHVNNPQINHLIDNQVTQCQKCLQTFNHLDQYEEHKKDCDSCKYECKKCKESFSTITSWKQHIDVNCPFLFQCPFCYQKFQYEYVLILHIEKECDQKNPKINQNGTYLCDFCGKFFKRYWKFLTHYLIHQREKPYRCENCYQTFKTRLELKDHLLTHKDERPYKCSECPKSFCSSKKLSCHKRINHIQQQKYECQLCEKKYETKQSLDIHIRCHTEEKPFKCTKCTKCFRSTYVLRLHVKFAHTNEKPYKCEHCDKSFVTKSNMKSHAQTHFKKIVKSH